MEEEIGPSICGSGLYPTPSFALTDSRVPSVLSALGDHIPPTAVVEPRETSSIDSASNSRIVSDPLPHAKCQCWRCAREEPGWERTHSEFETSLRRREHAPRAG